MLLCLVCTTFVAMPPVPATSMPEFPDTLSSTWVRKRARRLGRGHNRTWLKHIRHGDETSWIDDISPPDTSSGRSAIQVFFCSQILVNRRADANPPHLLDSECLCGGTALAFSAFAFGVFAFGIVVAFGFFVVAIGAALTFTTLAFGVLGR